jgi:Secretion system C-terminal sorting domain
MAREVSVGALACRPLKSNFMKATRRFITLTVFMLTVASSVHAQCVVENLKSITYDTVVYGSGNTTHNVTFPQFNPTLGTLTEVRINTKVTLRYSFQLENKELIRISNYRVRAVREDEISSTSLMVPLTSLYQKTYGPYSLAATDGIPGSGVDYTAQGPMYVMNNTNTTYTVYNTADYMGPGTVNFDYVTSTYSTVLGSINYAFNGTAEDTVAFSISYIYCTATMLPADITAFTAQRKDDATIDINWISHNEKNALTYELQKSNDGRNYMGTAHFAAKANANQTAAYRYSYTVGQSDNNKVMFRLKQIDIDGKVKYSSVRVVDMNTNRTNQVKLYPNPTRNTATLLFNNTKRGDWQVEISSMGGQVLQRYHYSNVLTIRLNTNGDLNRGIYLVKASNKKTNEQFTERLVIQ